MAQISDFAHLYRDLVRRPATLVPNDPALLHKANSGQPGGLLLPFLETRTAKHFIRLLVTQELEKKVHFILMRPDVPARISQTYHAEWLRTRCLSGDGDSLRCDVVRFIVCCVHPSNDVLGSNASQRWQYLTSLIFAAVCLARVHKFSLLLCVIYQFCFDRAH